MKYIKILKAIPFTCVLFVIATNQAAASLPSVLRLLISVFLLGIAAVAVILLRAESPRGKDNNKQIILLSAFLIITTAVYLYLLNARS